MPQVVLIKLVEMRRVELLTSALRTQRSAKLSYIPTDEKFKVPCQKFQVRIPTSLSAIRSMAHTDNEPCSVIARPPEEANPWGPTQMRSRLRSCR